MNTIPKNWGQLKNEDKPKHEDKLKNENEHKSEEDPKKLALKVDRNNKNNTKKEDDLQN